jgi:hypothetical protein
MKTRGKHTDHTPEAGRERQEEGSGVTWFPNPASALGEKLW